MPRPRTTHCPRHRTPKVLMKNGGGTHVYRCVQCKRESVRRTRASQAYYDPTDDERLHVYLALRGEIEA